MKKHNVFIYLLFVFVFISCPNDNQNETKEIYPSAIIIAGYESNGNNNVIKIWKSIDGGKTWSVKEITDGTHDTLVYGLVEMDSKLYLLGREHNGEEYIRKIWKSIDFGINWVEKIVNSERWWSNSAYFTDGVNLFLSASLNEPEDLRNGGNIWKSIDEGENWSVITNERIGGGAVTVNGASIYAVGAGSKVYKCINGAETWSSTTTLINMTQTFPGGIFVDGSNIYVVGSDYSAPSGCGIRVWISTDNGENWITKILSNENLIGYSGRVFKHNSIVYISGYELLDEDGENYNIKNWRSDDEGLTWSEINGSIFIDNYSYGNSLYVLGNELNGDISSVKLWKTNNDGENWIKYPITNSLNTVNYRNLIVIE